MHTRTFNSHPLIRPRTPLAQPDLPLSLMFSSGLDTDSLVSGFWSAWFNELRHVALRGGQPAAKSVTLCRLFASAERRYHRENKYEALNHLKEVSYRGRAFGLDGSSRFQHQSHDCRV